MHVVILQLYVFSIFYFSPRSNYFTLCPIPKNDTTVTSSIGEITFCFCPLLESLSAKVTRSRFTEFHVPISIFGAIVACRTLGCNTGLESLTNLLVSQCYNYIK